MFIIVKNNNVVLGPMVWNQNIFQRCLKSEFKLDVVLPLNNRENNLVVVNDEIKIYPVINKGPNNKFDRLTQFLNGPFYNFFDDRAELYTIPTNKTIELIKHELKSKVSANRYKYEIRGFSHTIQNTNVKILSDRESRNLYIQAFQLGSDNVSWKFGNIFLTLSNVELGEIVSNGAAYIQSVFDWEKSKFEEIDNCSNYEDFSKIELINSNLEPTRPIDRKIK